jgi:hypothetical protein
LIGAQSGISHHAAYVYLALIKAVASERRNVTLSIARDDRQRKMIDTGTGRLPWARGTVPLADDR